MLALDLGVFQRKAHFPYMREALAWSIVWVVISLLFNLYIWYDFGTQKALEFFTGYIVEKALSVDNIFVFIVIFSYFSVPADYQHKVLFWGVLSAIIMRAIFIVAGAALIAQFHWILYIFGVFLIYTAVKLARQKETEVHPERNPLVRFARKFFPVTSEYHGPNFFVRIDGKRFATPLFIVLVMIESTDVAFATDSIPAIFAITQDTFIIYTSNIFAILGLRALYFVLANFIKKFRYLKLGLSIVLGFIGIKMLIEPFYDMPIQVSLLVILGVLTVSILASVKSPNKNQQSSEEKES
jgi:tellurite resistance protein TerC